MDIAERQPETIQVRVLFFSILREEIGRSEIGVELRAPATGAGLLEELQRRHPVLVEHRPLIRLAVNQQFAEAGAPLSEGDEVALITPVSGG